MQATAQASRALHMRPASAERPAAQAQLRPPQQQQGQALPPQQQARQRVLAAAAAAPTAATPPPPVRPEAEVPRMAAFLDNLKWDNNGLVVAIAQHADTGEVLMQAFADRAAVNETLQTGCACGGSAPAWTHAALKQRAGAWWSATAASAVQAQASQAASCRSRRVCAACAGCLAASPAAHTHHSPPAPLPLPSPALPRLAAWPPFTAVRGRGGGARARRRGTTSRCGRRAAGGAACCLPACAASCPKPVATSSQEAQAGATSRLPVRLPPAPVHSAFMLPTPPPPPAVPPQVLSVYLDCDRDSLIYLAEPIGPACHTNAPTCYFKQAGPCGGAGVGA